MTRTDIKKANFRLIKNLLIDEYNAYSVENEGAYFHMFIDFQGQTLQCELSRDCQFGIWDAVKLSGNGWSEDEIAKQKAASNLETDIDTKIEDLTQPVPAN